MPTFLERPPRFRGAKASGAVCRFSGVMVASGVILFSWSHPPARAETLMDESLRGIVRAVDQAGISTDLGFRIVTLPFREGQSFKKGDVLVTFDCGDLEAEAKSAEARLQAEQLTHENTARLAKLSAAGRFDVQIAKAKADQAEAELEAYRSKLSRCVVEAPFEGRIAALLANAHEIPDRTRPVMQIVGLSTLEIDMLLPSQWLRWLKPGVPFEFHIDETGKTVSAEVSREAAVVDPVSQTVKVFGRFTGDASGVLPGMSGPVKFVVPDG